MLELIAARAENGVIGKDQGIPWRVKGEQRLFREITLGGTLIMGRKTFESIGRPLPGRHTLIISASGYQAPSPPDPGFVCATLPTLQAALDRADQLGAPTFIAGGGQVYREALPMADGIHLTTIHANFDGDVTFPDFSPSEFELVAETRHESNIHYTYRHYRRRERS